uniref:Uncharacterized protein n=1 Tax=Amphimedon queenslandica TaxID=400682 RepID=A0A1X7VU78_AMPQE
MKNAIHRTALPNDPKNNVQATEDFLELVLVAYIVTAAENEYLDKMDIREVRDTVINKYVNLGDNKIISSSKESMFL